MTSSVRATFVCLFLAFSSAMAVKIRSGNGYCFSWNGKLNYNIPGAVLCNPLKPAAGVQTDWTQKAVGKNTQFCLTTNKNLCLAVGPLNMAFVLKAPNATDNSQLFTLSNLKQLRNVAAGTSKCAEISIFSIASMALCQTGIIFQKQQFSLV